MQHAPQTPAAKRDSAPAAPKAAAVAPTVQPRAEAVAALSLPRFVRLVEDEGAEGAAHAAAHGAAPSVTPPRTDALTRDVAKALARSAGPGRPLAMRPAVPAGALAHVPAAASARARVHDDGHAHRLAAGLGAKAVTIGRDMYFAAGRYAPDTPAGQRLLAHELTHVAQQGGEPLAIQRDRDSERMDVPLGFFLVTMHTRSYPGVDANLIFSPSPDGPLAAQIGIVQVAKITDQSGHNGQTAGQPIDWSKVQDAQTGASGEASRNQTRTQGGDGVEAGWGVDVSHDAAQHPPGSNTDPNYQTDSAAGASGAYGVMGWLRAPDDFQQASLIDTPKRAADTDFRFEAYARGSDNGVTYGGVAWGFNIRNHQVSDDYARPLQVASAAFNAAMARFRGFFSLEDVVLYFDSNADRADAGEAGKLDAAVAYLEQYPDAHVQITGYADHRGGEDFNKGLSQRRAEHVAGLLRSRNVGGRIDSVGGAGETDQFSPLSSVVEDKDKERKLDAAGARRVNRRVVVHVVRTNAPTSAPAPAGP